MAAGREMGLGGSGDEQAKGDGVRGLGGAGDAKQGAEVRLTAQTQQQQQRQERLTAAETGAAAQQLLIALAGLFRYTACFRVYTLRLSH